MYSLTVCTAPCCRAPREKPAAYIPAGYGYNDIVYQMANQTDCPSYGYWVKQGYTTTPEYWDVGAFSQNHCMMDHIEEWFFSQLGGIQNGGMAYDVVNIKPWIPADMNRLDVTTRSIYGDIRCHYARQEGGAMDYSFDIPANSKAEVEIDCSEAQEVRENNQTLVKNASGVENVEYKDGKAYLTLGSGTYNLQVVSKSPTSINKKKADTAVNADTVYDLAGRRVSSMTATGNNVYIINSKKVLR